MKPSSSLRVKVVENTYDKLVIEVENTRPAFLNSLRRASISEVPILAIDEVVIYENDSVMWDEVLAHRLALVPLKVDPSDYEVLLDCYKSGEDCAAVFVLDEEAVERVKTVYSGHLRFEGFEGAVEAPRRINVEVVSKKIPLVKLARGQRLRLTAIARMGVGRDHAKWQPTAAVAYKFKARINILREPTTEEAEALASLCPRKVFKVVDGRLIVDNLDACNTCRECQDKYPDIVSVGWDDSSATFFIESVGPLPAWKILLTAADILEERASGFLKAVEAAIGDGGKPES